MKRTRAILVSTLILLTALLVCTGCSSNKKEASPYVQNFVGTWELSSMVQDGKEVTEQDVEVLKQKNYRILTSLTSVSPFFGSNSRFIWLSSTFGFLLFPASL